jgi:hypothetical protein
MTLAQARDKVGDALYFGQLAAQNAQAGAPIFQAIADAQEAKDWIEGQIPFYSLGGGPALPNVTAKVDAIVSEVYDAAAQIQDNGEQTTGYTVPAAPVPWGLLAVGGVALAGAGWLVFARKRRAAA